MKQAAEDTASLQRSFGHGDETRTAIVSAAIRVIAECGVEGASLRAINVAAGCRNSSAAHYHFGTKFHIVEAAIGHILAEINRGQEPLLSALEARAREGRPISVREILEASYLPYFSLLTRPDFGPTAAKFMSRLLVESDAQLQDLINRSVVANFERGLELVRAALPHLPEDVLKLRMLITITNVVHGAGDFNAIQNSPFGDPSGGNPLLLLHTMLDYMAAAAAAPPTPLTAHDETRMTATLFPPA